MELLSWYRYVNVVAQHNSRRPIEQFTDRNKHSFAYQRGGETLQVGTGSRRKLSTSRVIQMVSSALKVFRTL